jgi:uncharacterized membrane protein YedE/YeeE
MEKHSKDQFQYALAAIVVAGFFAVLAGLLIWSVPAENKSSLDIAIGALVAGLGTVLGYFFGSSKGSSEKNDLLAAPPKE